MTMTAFDPTALASLYAPQALVADISDLVHKLGDVQEMVLRALTNVESRTKKLKSFHETFNGFGIDPTSHIPEACEAAKDLAQQDHDIQSMGATSVAKCVSVIDLMMRTKGVDPVVCQELTHRAFEMCLNSLPERVKKPWGDYFELVGLSLATISHDGVPHPSVGPIRI